MSAKVLILCVRCLRLPPDDGREATSVETINGLVKRNETGQTEPILASWGAWYGDTP